MLTAVPIGLEHLMNVDPEILGGEPCFNGTRVPLETVTDNLAAGHGIEEILDNYPSLSREHVQGVLRWQWGLVHAATGPISKVS